MADHILIRIPSIPTKDVHAELLRLMPDMEQRGLKLISKKGNIEDGLSDTSNWVSIAFESTKVILQLLGLIVSYRNIKLSRHADGRGSQTINQGEKPERIREKVKQVISESAPESK